MNKFWDEVSDQKKLSERKNEWKQIKNNLIIIASENDTFKRKFIKYHEELFFTGELNIEAASRGSWLGRGGGRSSCIEKFGR